MVVRESTTASYLARFFQYDRAVPRPPNELSVPLRVLDGDFAGWLRDAMDSRGLSARMVGLRTGIHYSSITRLAQGNRAPSLVTAVARLRLLGTAPENLAVVRGVDQERILRAS